MSELWVQLWSAFTRFERLYYGERYKDKLEITTLAYIARNDSIKNSDLAVFFGRDKSYTTRILKNLEKKGFIAREQNSLDWRTIQITITQKGREYLEEVNQEIESNLNSLERKIGKDNSDFLIGCIRIFTDAVLSIEPPKKS